MPLKSRSKRLVRPRICTVDSALTGARVTSTFQKMPRKPAARAMSAAPRAWASVAVLAGAECLFAVGTAGSVVSSLEQAANKLHSINASPSMNRRSTIDSLPST